MSRWRWRAEPARGTDTGRRAGRAWVLGAVGLIAAACTASTAPASTTTTTNVSADRAAAQSTELVAGDLPGWQAVGNSSTGTVPLWEQLAACVGGLTSGAGADQELAMASAEFDQGTLEVTSGATVLHRSADVVAAARALASTKVAACAAKTLAPFTETGLPTGSVVSDVRAVTLSVPGSARPAFAWRFTMAVSVPQQGAVQVVEDLLGATVGRLEVDVTMVKSDGTFPDASTEARLLSVVVRRAGQSGL